MEKVTRLIPMGMLSVYLIKCLILGSSAIDAAVIASLAALTGYFQFKTEQKEITEIKTQLSSLKLDIESSKKRDEEIRSHVNSMKLGMNMRSGSLNNKG
jgi:hypothetical protein